MINQCVQISDKMILNVGPILTAAWVPDDAKDAEFKECLEITPVVGDITQYTGPIADAIWQRLLVNAQETQHYAQQLVAAVAQAEQLVANLQAQQTQGAAK